MKFILVYFLLIFMIINNLFSFNETFQIKGKVQQENITTPIDSARVRIQGSNGFVFSDANGKFIITTEIDSATWIAVSAGKEGWYSKDINAKVGDTSVVILLETLPPGDHMDYEFHEPEYCETCHDPIYEQWKESKHAGAAKNQMVLQLLNGTDVHGNEGIAPGFKLDNPFQGGDCADCHAPTAAQWNPGNTDLNDVGLLGTVDTNGVFCDFCHKISDVPVNYGKGINGSIILKRPSSDSDKDINLGPLDDVTSFWMGATYSPIHTKSDLCSGCHQYANEAGVIVDDTYDSWAESPYAVNGTQCQDCHMKPFADSIFVSGIGLVDAVKRDPARLYNHFFRKFGTTDSSATAHMKLDHHFLGDTLTINVAITNKNAGHKLPTGVSIRNMLFVLDLENDGTTIEQISGDTLPVFAGKGPVEDGNFSGFPGKFFALVTYDSVKNEWPTGNWAATGIKFDSRIPATSTDTSTFKFKIDPSKPVSITGKLLYRAVYKHWANVKGWDTREYLMTDTQMVVTPTALVEIKNRPDRFTLSQNYPNPFNPLTRIQFELDKPAQIEIDIFTIGGKWLANIFSEQKNVGNYSVEFNGEFFTSGVYIYRLKILERSGRIKIVSKKMILLK